MTSPTPAVSRPGRSAPLGPLAVGAAAVSGAAVLARHDPVGSGWYPQCPLHATTGWWCPGCGATRGLRHLVQGDVAAAVAANALLPLVVVGATLGWLAWWRAARGLPGPAVFARWRASWTVGLVGLVTVFTVLRNLEPFAALAP